MNKALLTNDIYHKIYSNDDDYFDGGFNDDVH